MKKKAQIIIDIQDYLDDALRHERIVTTRDDMTDLAIKTSSRTAAMSALASRAVGEAPEDILPSDKALLTNGTAASIAVTIAQMKRTVELKNGNTVEVREYNRPVANLDEDEDEAVFEVEATMVGGDGKQPSFDSGYSALGTVESCDNARQYLRRRIPGQIYNRFVEIIAAGESIKDDYDFLLDTLRDIYDRLEG